MNKMNLFVPEGMIYRGICYTIGMYINFKGEDT